MWETLLIGAKDAGRLLDMDSCIRAMREVFCNISAGRTAMLQRTMLPTASGNVLAGMAALNEESGVCGSKVIVFPGREAAATSQGIVPIFDAKDGRLLAIVEAKGLTARRTAAASAAATDLLAAPQAETLVLIGAGKLAAAHLEAICRVRPIRRVLVWARSEEKGRAFCAAHTDQELCPVYCGAVREAVQQADILCTLTKAEEPLVCGADLKPGVHINAVGACSPDVREVDTDCVTASRVFVDQREASLRDGGDLMIPIREGAFCKEQIAGEIGEVALGRIKGRQSPRQLTLFKSVGLAVQDLAAADLIRRRAIEESVGVRFSFS